MKLEECREEIDAIDEKIMHLINQRAKIARKIGNLKTKASMPVVDVKREKQILQKVCSKNNGILNNDSIVSILPTNNSGIETRSNSSYKKHL